MGSVLVCSTTNNSAQSSAWSMLLYPSKRVDMCVCSGP